MPRIYINPDYCKGCGICIAFCALGVLEKSKKLNKSGFHPPKIVRTEKCSGCKLCEIYCPDFAIAVEK